MWTHELDLLVWTEYEERRFSKNELKHTEPELTEERNFICVYVGSRKREDRWGDGGSWNCRGYV